MMEASADGAGRGAGSGAGSVSGAGAAADAMPLYHEQQRKQLCGLHALNNLLQREEFVQRDLEALADAADPPPRNPFTRLFHASRHKSRWGMGDYSIDILIQALWGLGFSYRWFDVRQKDLLPALMPIKSPRLLGFLVNQAGDGALSKMTGGRHWFAVRKVRGYGWINLDSELDRPEQFSLDPEEAEAMVLSLLRNALDNGGQVIEFYRTVVSGDNGGTGPPPNEDEEPLPQYEPLG